MPGIERLLDYGVAGIFALVLIGQIVSLARFISKLLDQHRNDMQSLMRFHYEQSRSDKIDMLKVQETIHALTLKKLEEIKAELEKLKDKINGARR